MTAHHLLGLLLPALLLLLGPRALAQTLRPTLDITPVPKEKLNPRLSGEYGRWRVSCKDLPTVKLRLFCM